MTSPWLEMYSVLVGETVFNVNYIRKYRATSSVLVGCQCWPLLPLSVISLHITEKKGKAKFKKKVKKGDFVEIFPFLLETKTRL